MALLGLGERCFHLRQWQEARDNLTPVLSWLVVYGYWMHEMNHHGLLAYACLFDEQPGLALDHFTALSQLAKTLGISSRTEEGHLGRSGCLSRLHPYEKEIALALAGDEDALTGGLHIPLAQLLYHRQEKQPVRALALWRVGTLSAQQQGTGPAPFRANRASLIHPVQELVASRRSSRYGHTTRHLIRCTEFKGGAVIHWQAVEAAGCSAFRPE